MMMMANADSSNDRAAKTLEEEAIELRAAVQHAVMQIVREEDEKAVTPTVTRASAVASMAEVAFLYATQSLGPDLVAFSQHANRKRITEADVKLVVRKDPHGLSKKIAEYSRAQAAAAAEKPKKTRVEVIDLQSKKRKQKEEESDDDDSSSEDEDLRQALEESNRTTTSVNRASSILGRRRNNALRDGDSSDSSLEVPESTYFASKKPSSSRSAQRNKFSLSSSDDDDDDSHNNNNNNNNNSMAGKPKTKPVRKATTAKPAFKLQFDRKESKESNGSSDSSDDDMLVDSAKQKERHLSRLQDILDESSDNSL